MLFQYLKNRLVEKTTQASIVAAIAALIANYTGISGEMLTATEEIIGGLVLLAIAAIPSEKMGAKQKVQSPAVVGCVVIAMLFLTGCGALGMNKQQYAGLERWEVSGNQTVEGNWQITDVVYTNGKELNTSDIAISLNGGETILNFTGSGIKAFEGQSLRAEVDKVISEEIGENIPGLTDAIMKLLGN